MWLCIDQDGFLRIHNVRVIVMAFDGKIVNDAPFGLSLSHIWDQYSNIFFKKKLGDISSFLESLIPLFWTSGYVSSGFQSQSGQPYLQLGRGALITCSLKFTSGVTPANPPNLDSSPCCCLTVWDQADALSTELCRLGCRSPIYGTSTQSIFGFEQFSCNSFWLHTCHEFLFLYITSKSSVD